MKITLFLVLIGAALSTNAQAIQGGYYTYAPKNSIAFDQHFYSFDGTQFIYGYSGCTETFYVAGTFQVRGDSLLLHSSEWPVHSQSPHNRAANLIPAQQRETSTRVLLIKSSTPSRLVLEGEMGGPRELEALQPAIRQALLAEYAHHRQQK